jgi:hypothetical protein
MNPESLPLRDIHPPAPVGWWPPAPGWWLVAACIVAVAVLLFVLRRRRRVPAEPDPVALARRDLAALREDYERHGDPRRLAGELSVLMRRTELSSSPRAEVAGVTGRAWLERLDARAGEPLFTRGPGRALADAPYRPTAEVDAPGLLAACARAIEGTTREAGT